MPVAGSSTRRHFGVARLARRGARKAGAVRAVSAARRLFKSASVQQRKLSAARRRARRGARKAAVAGKKVLRGARKAGLKRYSAMHGATVVKAVGTKSEVYKGLARHTSGGLKACDIVRKTIRRGGKVVHRYASKKKAAAGKARGLPTALRMWRSALKKAGARGVPRKGTSAYKRAKSIYKAMKADQSRSHSRSDSW